MKQLEPKKVTIADMEFFIYPFNAFKASNLLAEVSSVIAPLLTGVLPLISSDDKASLMDVDVSKATPAIVSAFNSLSGDKLEEIIKKLLVTNKNITVKYTDEGEERIEELDYDLVNQLFCGDVEDMIMLAYKVLEVNYGGFFDKAGNLFGKAESKVKIMKSKDTDISTPVSSPTLN